MLEELDLDDVDLQEPAETEAPTSPPDPEKVRKELERVREFIQRAETLARDSKAEKLLEVIRIIAERPAERRRIVIFTESLVTQEYLQQVLIGRGRFRAGGHHSVSRQQ